MTTETIEIEVPTIPQLRTIDQFCQEHPWSTPGGIRFQVFHAEENGLSESGAIVRIGRRVLINVPKYFGWVESKQKKGVA